MDKLNLKVIEENLTTDKIGKNIIYYEKTESTNVMAKKLASGLCHGTVLIAEEQSLGKGRKDNKWVSPPGVGAWMSIVLKPEIESEHICKIPVLVSLALQEMLEKKYGVKTWVKWPNDIIINNKKICGILTESSTKGMLADWVVSGIGINVNQDQKFFEKLPFATSLALQKGENISREELFCNVFFFLEKYYNEFIKTKRLNIKQIEETSILLNKKVKIFQEDRNIVATVIGFKEDGTMLVRDEYENTLNINGSVTVRGINSYLD